MCAWIVRSGPGFQQSPGHRDILGWCLSVAVVVPCRVSGRRALRSLGGRNHEQEEPAAGLAGQSFLNRPPTHHTLSIDHPRPSHSCCGGSLPRCCSLSLSPLGSLLPSLFTPLCHHAPPHQDRLRPFALVAQDARPGPVLNRARSSSSSSSSITSFLPAHVPRQRLRHLRKPCSH